MSKALRARAEGEKYRVCEQSFFDLGYGQPCPRCGKPASTLRLGSR